MSDVTAILNGQDSASVWRGTLEAYFDTHDFGYVIVESQMLDTNSSLIFTGEQWRATANFDEIITAQLAFPLPRLNSSTFPWYAAAWIDATRDQSEIFNLCWQGSKAARDCASELRAALDEEINFFKGAAATIHAERITEKLIA